MKKNTIIFLMFYFTVFCFVACKQSSSGNMVHINGGTFTMGSPEDEYERDEDEIQHQVTVNSFYMSKYEVTQKEYQEVMLNNPSYFKGDNLPVESLTWFDAIEYCIKRSQKEELTPVYTITDRSPTYGYPIWYAKVTVNWINNGYRLPTEAEWEYACRAGTTTPFNTGNNITTNQANYDGNHPYNNTVKGISRKKTTPVGTFTANMWGLYDMHGNVLEWCWDWYTESYNDAGGSNNPIGGGPGERRVVRGGAWDFDGKYLRSSRRGIGCPPGGGESNIGLRLVRE